ncbi:NUDIX hydrolase 6-like protein [Tanacetum coccineum]
MKPFYQAWERLKELLMKCPQHYLMEMQEVILFYNGLEVPTRQILDSKGAMSIKTVADAKARSTKTSDGLAAIQAQLNNLGREIKKVNEKVYAAQEGQYRVAAPGFYQRNNANPLYQEWRQSIQATIQFPSRLNDYCCDEKKGSYGPQYLNAYGATRIDDSIPQKEKDPGSFTLPCYINNVCFENGLADLGASVSVMPLSTYLNLGLGELAHTKLTVELADRTVKHPKGIAENVLVGIVVNF